MGEPRSAHATKSRPLHPCGFRDAAAGAHDGQVRHGLAFCNGEIHGGSGSASAISKQGHQTKTTTRVTGAHCGETSHVVQESRRAT
jgi:hypothetical protein